MSNEISKQLGAKLKPTKVEQACSALENSPLQPLVIWALNMCGIAGVQTLTSKVANDFNTKQILNLFLEIKRQLPNITPDPKSDQFMAGLNLCLSGQLETCSQRKTVYFAAVLSKLWITESAEWSETAQTLKLVRELEDIHILILREALQLSAGANGATVTFHVGSANHHASIQIDQILKNIDPMLITSCISDLISRGLLNDSFESDGGRRVPGNANSPTRPADLKYSISNFGKWFLDRIKELDESRPSPIKI